MNHQEYGGFGFDYHDFWVLQRDDTQPTGYRHIKSPVPYFSSGCGFYVACGGDGQTLQTSDVNGDGLPEWVFAVGRLCGSERLPETLKGLHFLAFAVLMLTRFVRHYGFHLIVHDRL
jgi:hypothetical protein